jgi:hypothetical protein
MKHGLICKLKAENGAVSVELYDSVQGERGMDESDLFTVVPESIEEALGKKEFMAQLGENIFIRLATANGINL